MITTERLAQEAHAVYRQKVIEKVGQHAAPLRWDSLCKHHQEAKIAATRHIVEKAKEVH